MKKLLAVVVLSASIVGFMFGFVLSSVLISPSVHAQNPTLSPYEFQVTSAAHTSCAVVTGQTSYCFASDGAYQSIGGAAFVQLGGTVAGIGGTSPIVVSGTTISCPTCITGSGTVGQVADFTTSQTLSSETLSYSSLTNLPTTTGSCTGGTITGTAAINTSGPLTVTVTNADLTGCPF